MTSMVQPSLGPPPTPKYPKEDPPSVLRDQHRQNNHSPQQQQQQQHPRSAGLVQQQGQPKSPHHSNAGLPQASSYGPPQVLNGGVPLQQHHQQQQPQRQSSYAPQAQESGYYTSHPGAYTLTSAPSQYPSSEAPDLMAATAQMQRPYPPIYHNPQPNSPASVPSPQATDQHGRSLYGQSPQLPQTMYSYGQYPPMNPMHSGPYAQHPATSQHPQLASQQPLLVGPPTHPPHLPPQHAPQPPPQPHPHPGTMTSSSPRMKMEAPPQQPTPPQRGPPMPTSHPGASAPPMSTTHSDAASGGATNTTAAPGPIPATTPLVVRQDGSGVQWIAFEYSRDRVKMEYTIRCDVENINIENLSQEFKTENCVYPRACCTKDQYRGNRLVYETECNAVGWALAELNTCLRGKRGLIQRAVDSWRNSNQDPRLRSRRVRRMAKVNNRKSVAAQHGTPIGTPSAPALPQGLPNSGGSMNPPTTLAMGPQQLHHHHAHPDATQGQGPEDVSGTPEYTNGSHRQPPAPSSYAPQGPPADLRQGHVFHGYPSYAPTASSNISTGPSMPPLLRDGAMDHPNKHPTVAASNSGRNNTSNNNNKKKEQTDDHDVSNTDIFGDLPEGRRRKFILVEDPQRGSRVRVKAMLDQVDMNEIPDSYRKSNSVFPRSYFPVHSPFGRGRRFDGDDDDDDAGEQQGGGSDGCGEGATSVGRTMVSVPTLEGEGTVAVPKISKRKRGKEVVLNDLAYRMSWGQSRVFAGRTLFLQRSLDAYRNKMRSTMLNAGQDVSSVASHFQTRAGKRKWQDRSKPARARSGSISISSTGRDPRAPAAAVLTSISARDAEEVEP